MILALETNSILHVKEYLDYISCLH